MPFPFSSQHMKQSQCSRPFHHESFPAPVAVPRNAPFIGECNPMQAEDHQRFIHTEGRTVQRIIVIEACTPVMPSVVIRFPFASGHSSSEKSVIWIVASERNNYLAGSHAILQFLLTNPRFHLSCRAEICSTWLSTDFLPGYEGLPYLRSQMFRQLIPMGLASPHRRRHLFITAWPMTCVEARLLLP